MGFEQVFDSLTFKHMDALRKQIQSLGDCVWNQITLEVLFGLL